MPSCFNAKWSDSERYALILFETGGHETINFVQKSIINQLTRAWFTDCI